MTADQFKKAANALSGERWSMPDMADALKVDVRSVQRWVSAEAAVPAGIAEEICEMLNQRRPLIDRLLREIK